MDAHNNGNEQQQTIQATKGNGNLKGGIPMNPVTQTNPVMQSETLSATEALAQQLGSLVGAARTAKVEPTAWRRASANARPTRMRLEQPLLFVGLGGTGRQIATRVKAAFIERFGHVPENAILLAFDSAEDPVSVREGRHGSVVTLEVGASSSSSTACPWPGSGGRPNGTRTSSSAWVTA